MPYSKGSHFLYYEILRNNSGCEKINVFSQGFDITLHIRLNMGIYKRIILF